MSKIQIIKYFVFFREQIRGRSILICLIRLYQKTISPDHGLLKGLFPNGYCRFQPTCSQYGIKAIEQYGVIQGMIFSAGRILRCNPWNKGGWDPVNF